MKGIQTVDDAVNYARLGADAIVISNHGGRQLENAPASVILLPRVAQKFAELGIEAEVYIDGCLDSGKDVIGVMALGAQCALLGRSPVHALMAAGQAGVERLLELYLTDIERNMRLLGVTRLAELGPDNVYFGRPGPAASLDYLGA